MNATAALPPLVPAPPVAKALPGRHSVPAPGLAFGPYPQRTPAPWPHRAGVRAMLGLQARLAAWGDALAEKWQPAASSPADPLAFVQAVRHAQAQWAARHAIAWGQPLHALRAELGRQGWRPRVLQAEALGCVAAAAERALGRNPFDSQLLAARVLLQGELAEMATGEGKTLAAALAAAVAALAGTPVHVLTVNDYLVQRDADTLRPLYTALGLSVGSVLAAQALPQRQAAYACDVAYATAREVAFDWLRDRLTAAPEASALQRGLARWLDAGSAPDAELHRPRLRGLCMAVVDEADSLLIDEASLPLILSEPMVDDQLRAACYQALRLAFVLRPGEHFRLATGSEGGAAGGAGVHFLPEAEATIDSLATGLGGAWLNRRHRQELLGQALQALHGLQRDTHYLVRDKQVQLLDASTGRVAEGRRWARSLHALVELKEGLTPSPASRTVARISVQRFFAHYLHLCGMSGTLRECRAELRQHYGLAVRAVPLRQPLQRRQGPSLLFTTEATRRLACAAHAQRLAAQGSAVLVGTASVAASQAMSEALKALGAAHRVLDARHDAQEAAIVADAGQAGSITVATQMAGRGTDILLGTGVAERGGLHVINCQDNAEPRLDRQLHGRAGRQGEPGHAEAWHTLDSALLAASPFSRLMGHPVFRLIGGRRLPQGRWLQAWALRRQRALARQQRHLRLHLLQQEQQWQHDLSFTTLRA